MHWQQLDPAVPVQFLDYEVHELAVVWQPQRGAVLLPDLPVGFRRNRPECDLVAEAPPQGVVGNRFRWQVGGEHEYDVERNREVRAAADREMVDALLHRHDPAIQDLLDRGALA